MNTKRNVIVVAIVVVVAVFVGYKYYPKAFQFYRSEESRKAINELDVAIAREVSTLATYKTPDGEDKVRFTLGLNKGGVVVGVKTEDVLKPSVVNSNLDKFSQNLLVVIKGKKLSELIAVDKVGSSSLTTGAFNEALERLKSQI